MSDRVFMCLSLIVMFIAGYSLGNSEHNHLLDTYEKTIEQMVRERNGEKK